VQLAEHEAKLPRAVYLARGAACHQHQRTQVAYTRSRVAPLRCGVAHHYVADELQKELAHMASDGRRIGTQSVGKQRTAMAPANCRWPERYLKIVFGLVQDLDSLYSASAQSLQKN
jgi:hypothetical protein